PFLYGTAKRFLQVFGLRQLDELPRAEDLRRGQGGPVSEPEPPVDATIHKTTVGASRDEH
ncbi:MAG TPA: hypothetical protein VG433_03940, partial [Pirellulales bacterium]|nr:hypothetical protein [Pirellulales bacterium]